ncbi:MAG TPA: tetratricopeptide repeat protein [bacterium]
MKQAGLFCCLTLFWGLTLAPASSQPDSLSTPTPPSDPFSSGLVLFQQKQYAAALPLFEQAVQENPSPKAYYHLAYCQYLTGDLKDAALNFYREDQLNPSPPQKRFADKLKDKLSLNDQEWVESQLQPANPSAPVSLNTPPPPVSSRVKPDDAWGTEMFFGRFGLRASAEVALLNMQDFNTEANSFGAVGLSYKKSDPSLTYGSSVPGIDPLLVFNPFFSFGDFEIGPKISYLFSTSATYYRGDSYGYATNVQHAFDTFSLALESRYYLRIDKKSRLFIEPSFGFQPLHMDSTFSYRGTSSTPSSGNYGFHTDGTGLDLGLRAGVQFVTGPNFTVSVMGGYEYAVVQNLHGTYYDSNYPNMNGTPGTAVMEHSPYWGQDFVWFLPDDPSKNNFFYSSAAEAQSARPLKVDFSGIRAAVDFAYLF